MRTLITLFGALLAFGAQAQYPTRPITMIVPFPPGGVADIVGRPLAASMEKTLGQPVVVVNRPGAGGAVGMTAAARSDPDGYTILMALSSISIFPVSDPLNGKPAPYQISDFVPVALVTADPTVLVVGASSPYKTVAEFVAGAKANPGKINYSSSGVYGTLHVAMEMFANAAGIQLFHVPYQGGGHGIARAARREDDPGGHERADPAGRHPARAGSHGRIRGG
jgi:tripartite-type tricarboxylate transporter receptor subunit TctC